MDHGYLSKTVPPDKFCRGDSFCQNSTILLLNDTINVNETTKSVAC